MRKTAICLTCVAMFLLSSCGHRYVIEADKGELFDKAPINNSVINSLGNIHQESPDAVHDGSDTVQAGSDTVLAGSNAVQNDSNAVQEETNAVQGNSNAQQEASIADNTLSQKPSLGEQENGISQAGIKLSRVGLAEGFYYEELSEAIKSRITGKSYPTDCNVPYSDLRYVKVLHYDFNGNVHEGELICAKEVAQELTNIFYELYLAKYPIEKMVLVDEYDADDIASMRDNNTSCFNFRVISGSKKLSMHSYGLAIDINPLINPYVKGDYISPKEAKPYVDRSQIKPGMISKDDLCYKLFTKYGWKWGGIWNTVKDYQHFEKEITK